MAVLDFPSFKWKGIHLYKFEFYWLFKGDLHQTSPYLNSAIFECLIFFLIFGLTSWYLKWKLLQGLTPSPQNLRNNLKKIMDYKNFPRSIIKVPRKLSIRLFVLIIAYFLVCLYTPLFNTFTIYDAIRQFINRRALFQLLYNSGNNLYWG